jgi:hypothetical protein
MRNIFIVLAQPWRKFPQTVMFYAVLWFVGGVLLTFLHVWGATK